MFIACMATVSPIVGQPTCEAVGCLSARDATVVGVEEAHEANTCLLGPCVQVGTGALGTPSGHARHVRGRSGLRNCFSLSQALGHDMANVRRLGTVNVSKGASLLRISLY